MPMTQDVRRQIDQLREEIRTIGATLRQLREDLAEVDQVKSGPRGEIDLALWNKGEEVRHQIRVVISRREEVQGRLNDLLRPFRAARIVPALRETGGSVREFITEVRAVLPIESSATPHLREALDGAIGIDDEGHMLGKILDLFMFREIRGAVEQVLGIRVSNGNGG
ncbi:MAG: hypothetical protein O7H41_03770 [Planctomycetota bacterium]|nr:hypothetical protein [Planctomycetota bacterium]